MALFDNLQLTDLGFDLMHEAMTSQRSIQFTHIAVGDGILPGDQQIAELGGLISEKARLPLETFSDGRPITMTARLATDSLREHLYHREIGIYAGSVLFAYANSGDEYDFIPSPGTNAAIQKIISVSFDLSNLQAVFRDINTDQLVTQTAFNTRINQLIPEKANEAVQTALSSRGNVFLMDKTNVVTGLTTFTQQCAVGKAQGGDDAVNFKQLSGISEYCNAPSASSYIRIPIEQTMSSGHRYLPDGYVSLSVPAGIGAIGYGWKWFQSGMSVIGQTMDICHAKLAARQIITCYFPQNTTKAEGILCCPLKAPRSGSNPSVFEESTVLFDLNTLCDTGNPSINGGMTLIGIKPEQVLQFCSRPLFNSQVAWDDAYLAEIYERLPHDFSYIAVTHDMGGPLYYYPYAFYIDAVRGKAIYMGKTNWLHYNHATLKPFFSLRKSVAGKIIVKFGRINRFSGIIESAMEHETELTDLDGEFLAWTNSGGLNLSNMYYKNSAI